MKASASPRYCISFPEPTETHRDRSRRALQRAISLADSQEELAFALGIASSNFTRWKILGEVPPHHALGIEVYTEGLVRAGLLCPRLDKSLRPRRVRVRAKAQKVRRAGEQGENA